MLRRSVGAIAIILVLLAGAGCEQGFQARTLDFGSGDAWTGNAICYGPHRDGQRPGGQAPTDAQLTEDLALLQEHWQVVRIFGASGFAGRFLKVIREQKSPVRVVLGIWLGPENAEDNRREIAAGIRLANDFEDLVMAVSVGNDTQVHWSSHIIPVEDIVTAIREVRSAVTQPVTTADDYDYWITSESQQVADEIDFLLVHAHPMWNGQQLEDGLTWLEVALENTRQVHPDRTVIIGETGWATRMHPEGKRAELIKGTPGEAEQKIFYEQVRAWSVEERIPVFWFEAFDENWKGGPHPDEVEKNWGLYRADRTRKVALEP
jgi:exo-beta-1,3-glucanase (GH17 family)